MNSRMVQSLPVMLLSVGLLSLPSCTNPPPPSTEHTQTRTVDPGVPGGITVETTTTTANIVSVFASTREVVLDLPGGKRQIVTCGPAIINFDQFKAGDQVKATLTQEVAVYMGAESDIPSASDKTGIALAPKGGSPGGVMANIKQVTATVVSIDIPRHTATLQYPDGVAHEVMVRSDVDLSKRHVGEKVIIRKTDIIAIRVEKP